MVCDAGKAGLVVGRDVRWYHASGGMLPSASSSVVLMAGPREAATNCAGSASEVVRPKAEFKMRDWCSSILETKTESDQLVRFVKTEMTF